MEPHPDFIVSELLSELKTENARKSSQIQRMSKIILITIIAAVTSCVLLVAGFLAYFSMYDFSSATLNSAEGFYAIVDSDGNVVGADFTAEEIEQFLEAMNTDG